MNPTFTVTITKNYQHPVYQISDSVGTACEIDLATLKRWENVIYEFETVQLEMAKKVEDTKYLPLNCGCE